MMDLKTAALWGSILISVMASLAFLVALTFAYARADHDANMLLIGAVISNFSSVVSFWVGSSIGSQKKDDALAAKAPPSDPQHGALVG